MRALAWFLLYLPALGTLFAPFTPEDVDLGSIFDDLGDILIAEVVTLINELFSALLAFTSLGFATTALATEIEAEFMGRVGSTLGRALRHILGDIIHLRFAHLLQDYLKLKETLRRWLLPIIKIIDRIRKIYRFYVLKPLLAYLNLIQRLRQVLAIFRIFHLKFAERLDHKLLELEAKTIRNTLRIWQELNIATSVLQLILDPALLFRRVPLVTSITRAIGDLLRALFGRGLQDAFGSTVPLSVLGGPPVTLREGMDRWQLEVRGETGAVAGAQWQRIFDEMKVSAGG